MATSFIAVTFAAVTFVLTTMLALVKPRVFNKDRAYFVKKFEKNVVRKNVTRTNFLRANVIELCQMSEQMPLRTNVVTIYTII